MENRYLEENIVVNIILEIFEGGYMRKFRVMFVCVKKFMNLCVLFYNKGLCNLEMSDFFIIF